MKNLDSQLPMHAQTVSLRRGVLRRNLFIGLHKVNKKHLNFTFTQQLHRFLQDGIRIEYL